jgi:hypothetical protein
MKGEEAMKFRRIFVSYSKPRCSFLNDSGRQCPDIAKYTANYFGDPEFSDFRHETHPPWVKVQFCEKHMKGML